MHIYIYKYAYVYAHKHTHMHTRIRTTRVFLRNWAARYSAHTARNSQYVSFSVIVHRKYVRS